MLEILNLHGEQVEYESGVVRSIYDLRFHVSFCWMSRKLQITNVFIPDDLHYEQPRPKCLSHHNQRSRLANHIVKTGTVQFRAHNKKLINQNTLKRLHIIDKVHIVVHGAAQ